MAVGEISLKMQPDDVRTLHGYSVDLGDIGNMLEASDPQEALKDYEKALEINLKLTRLSTDIRYKRSVAIGYGSIASVYDDMGDYPRAVENNMKDLAIYQDLVRADPKNALLRQGLAITYTNTAYCVRPRGQDCPGKGLLESWSRDHPATSFIRPAETPFSNTCLRQCWSPVVTILTAANEPEAAKTELERARSIYESRYKAGATNQVNVAAADVKLGEAVAKAGHDQDAADYFHQALAGR